MAIINGTPAAETLLGTPGNDTITSGAGNDVVRMRAGDDVFVWNPGDGDDKVEGQDGFDTFLVNGSAGFDALLIGANGARAGVLHFGQSIFADIDGVERIWVRALGDGDVISVDDLAGTAVQQVVVDLAGTVGGTVGDGTVDAVNQNGTFGSDAINVTSVNGRVLVSGLSAQLIISHTDANDELEVDGLAGNDTINASALAAGLMQVQLDGAEGNDRLTGSTGNDELFGDDGNDIITGGRGNDYAELGEGNDVYIWNAGDGDDVVEGEGGTDTLRFTGANVAESINFVENFGRLSLFRFLGSTKNRAIDADDVERIQVRTLAGADQVLVDDVTGTDVKQVAIDLAAVAGGTLADASVDVIRLAGTDNADLIEIAWSGTGIVTSGLAAAVSITHAGATDRLLVNGGDGADVIDATGLPAGKISMELDGGLGNDIIFGSAGNDMVNGGAGDDVASLGAGNDVLSGGSGNDIAFLGAGNDTFQWFVGDGNDVVRGRAGFDTLQFKGNAADEDVQIDAVGGRIQVTRNVSDGTVDLDDFERIRILARGGKDNIFVNDLAGTDVKQVAIELAADGEDDLVAVKGSIGNDLITVTVSAGVLSVVGLTTQVTVGHFDANDHLGINASDGNDTISAVSLPANSMSLSMSGGSGSDVVTGSAGRDILEGGDGADLLRGGGGSDQLQGGQHNDRMEGGAGNDALIGNEGDDVLLGGLGDDSFQGDQGNDTITGGAGNDTIAYVSILDGHDVILAFDGNPTGGQDTLSLEALFLNLLVAPADRAGRVSIVDKGATVDVFVDADGNGANGFELTVATLHTLDAITIGQDVIVGT